MSTLTVRAALFASLSAVAAFANIAAAVPAHAQDYQPERAVVRYGDLDLTSDAGIAKLNRRVATASGVICGTPDLRDLSATAHSRTCRADVMTRAAPQVADVIEKARNGVGYAQANSGMTVAAR